MPAAEIVWSKWRGSLALKMANSSPHADKFYHALRAFVGKANSNEEIHVCVWTDEFLYIEVHSRRWKHYPCKVRAVVSFDTDNGLLASAESRNRYTFCRPGWGRFMDQLVGYEVRRYWDCKDPARTERC
jgi:hypothetical protein